MRMFDGRFSEKHGKGAVHVRHGGHGRKGIVLRLKWLAASIAAVATLLSGGVIASANNVSTDDSKGSSKSSQAQTQDNPSPSAPQYQFLNFSQNVLGVDTADPTSLKAGEKFTYQFNLGCSERNCESASLADALPAALNGFKITDFSVAPNLQANVVWKNGETALPGTPTSIGANTSFTLTPGQQFVTTEGTKTGLVVGLNGTVNLTLQVPDDFSPGDSRNNAAFTNSATLSASNSKSVTADTTAKVSIAATHTVSVSAAFDPASQTYAPGASESLKLDVANTSNVDADKVTVQVPQDSQAGADATSLDGSNPFRFFNFDNFGATVMPTGATAVQVDAYAKGHDGQWNWVSGTAGSTFALPGGVSPSDVGGLRFTYTGTMAPNAKTATPVALALKQRESDRNDATNAKLADLTTATSMNASVQAAAAKGAETGASAVSSASVTLNPVQVGVVVMQEFNPARHPAGNDSTGSVTLTNGTSAVNKMTATVGKNFFDDDVTFGGFKNGITYPRGAASGKIVYHMLNNGSDQTKLFADGGIPASPSGKISSFDIEFDSASDAVNDIQNGTSTTVNYIVKSPGGYDFADGQDTKDFSDAATAKVVASNTAHAEATADRKTMTLVKPKIYVTVGKTVSPDTSVAVGHQAIVALKETTSTSSDYLQPNTITVEDSWADKTIDDAGAITEGTAEANDNDFWNAFDIESIQPTPVPANTALTVSVKIHGVGWVVLDSKAQTAGYSYHLSASDLAGKLGAAHSGATPDEVTGIQFKLATQGGGNPFQASDAISQYVCFKARDTRRSGGNTDEIEAHGAQKPTNYTFGNTTDIAAHGETDDYHTADSKALDVDTPSNPSDKRKVGILRRKAPAAPEHGEGHYAVDDWAQASFTDPDNSDAAMDTVPSQSGKKVTAHLKWGVDAQMKSVTLEQAGDVPDYGGVDTPKDQWRNVFDLVSINPIAVSDTPYTNGWYLKYDTIDKIQLYDAGGTWTEVTPPAGSWQESDGSFKGYTVPESDAGTITGVEISLAPNDTKRTTDVGNHVPYTPAPHSGVVASGTVRDFSSVWKIRDKRRSDNSFITGRIHLTDNDHEQPQSVRLHSVRYSPEDLSHPDTVAYEALNGGKLNIQDYQVALTPRGVVTHGDDIVPPSGVDAPQADYPTEHYDISATNAADNRASYLRITEPSECDNAHQQNCDTENTTSISEDPNPATGNPFTPARIDDLRTGKLDSDASMPNMFNRQDLTGIDFSSDDPNQISLDDSQVYILHYTPTDPTHGIGTFSPEEMSATHAKALTSDQLKDVVGVSVTFQGADPVVNGGSLVAGNYVHLKLDTRTRKTLRNTGKPFVPDADHPRDESDDNRATAQIYAPVTDTSDRDKVGNFVEDKISYKTGTLQASANENISPNDLVIVNPQVPQTVKMDAGSDSGTASTLSPTKVTLTSWPDGQSRGTGAAKTGDFWKNFDFSGLSSITFPAGATKVKIGVYGPFGTGGAMGWKDGDEQSQITTPNPSYAMPVAQAQYKQIQGLRFVFTNPKNSGELQLFTTTTNYRWNAEIQYQVVQREKVRGDDSTKVAYPGSQPNEMSTEVESKLNDGVNPDQSTSADASATMRWSLGTANLGLNEVANSGDTAVSVGQMVPWEITIANNGTGYLNISKVTADLPATLRYTGQGGPGDPAHPMTFTPGAVGGSSPSAGELTEEPTLDAGDSGKVVLAWPEGKNRMLPGEVAKAVIWLEVEPGARAGVNVVLPVTVNAEQHLDGVSSAPGTVASVDAVTDSGHTVGGQVKAFVTPSSGENVYIVGGVKGSLPGAINTLDPSQHCTTSLTVDGKDYYRNPCRANTAIDGKDDWVLHMVNAGTTTVKKVQFFEQLPAKHDKSIAASGDYRGSDYHPELTEAPKIVGAPAGTTSTIEVSTENSPCVGTWNTLPGIASGTPANVACSASAWTTSNAGTDWSKVTGLRITLDFTGTTAGVLQPDEGADVTYTSENAPKSSVGPQDDDSDPSVLASLDQTAGVQDAWGQFGILYTSVGGDMHASAPSRFGTRMETGSIKVGKIVSGAAAHGYAPQKVRASVSCRDADGEEMLFGGQSHGIVELDKQHDGTYTTGRLSDIPLSVDGDGNGNTVCTVSEDGQLGEFGETERTVAVNGDHNATDSDTMDITNSDTLDGNGQPSNEVAATQSAVLSNVYRYSGMSVTKKVDTKADKGSFGPFNFKAVCKTSDGQTVTFGGADSTTFTLKDGETWKAPADTIPANATCTITETDTSAADKTVFTGDNVTENEDGTASVKVGDGSAGDIAKVVSTTVTNHYDAGTLTVTRAVSGEGAARYGKAPVKFRATCNYRGQHLLGEEFDISGNGTKSFGIYPAGTQCTVEQLNDAGATKHTFLPKDGKVVIAKEPEPVVLSAAQPSQPSESSTPSDETSSSESSAPQSESPSSRKQPADPTKPAAQDDPANPTAPAVTYHNGISNVTVAEADEFDVSQVPVTLKRTGDKEAIAARGKGPFKVKAACTYQRDGKPTAIDLGGNDGTFSLSAANGYSTTLGDILPGAHCTVAQTDSAGADSMSIDPANGSVTVAKAADKNKVTITDVFRNRRGTWSLPGGFPGNHSGVSGSNYPGGGLVAGSAGGLVAGSAAGSPNEVFGADGGRFGNGRYGDKDGGSSMAQTGAAIAGIVVLVVILLAGGVIILYMRRRSAGGDESDVVSGDPQDSDDSPSFGDSPITDDPSTPATQSATADDKGGDGSQGGELHA